eukprot:NODE_2967_length_434_cov_0.823151_g2943_i0.p1 GENE.NODE_2967_length_434_cov_0.823151_g2943_i0~~NODE_2967_length_434_cov_0.823151_g2943_i0.p1  ORF type:complete len:124 (+),score=2.30 NODE_2967_length_434_cov_0.823151_g2943_i0:53-373(+)
MNITTLRKIIITFNQVMNYAVRHNYISYNPVRDAERPRGQGGEEKKEIKIFNAREINEFLNSVQDQKFNVLFTLAIMSGARQGELFGFEFFDLGRYHAPLLKVLWI